MDHILENEGKPLPDLSSISSGGASSSSGADDPMDEDDEDADALKSLVGKSAADLEAKVRRKVLQESSRQIYGLHSLLRV
jgi:UBX domain-containing protein 1/4